MDFFARIERSNAFLITVKITILYLLPKDLYNLILLDTLDLGIISAKAKTQAVPCLLRAILKIRNSPPCSIGKIS